MKIEASLVPETAKRDASAPGRCVQQKIALASIWTDAMLAALQSGVKGGKWHSLIDQGVSPGNTGIRLGSGREERRGGGSGPDQRAAICTKTGPISR